jgi:hypothetical protein
MPYIDPTCIRIVLHCNIKIETPRAPKIIPMCFNCQLAGHKANFCNQKSRCVRCAGPHASNACPNKDKPARCANCAGPHPASHRGCQYHVRIVQRFHQQNPQASNDQEGGEEEVGIQKDVREETHQENIWRKSPPKKTNQEDFPPLISNNTSSDPTNRQQDPPTPTNNPSQAEITEEELQNQPGPSTKKTYAETIIHKNSKKNPNHIKPPTQKSNITPTNQPSFPNTQKEIPKQQSTNHRTIPTTSTTNHQPIHQNTNNYALNTNNKEQQNEQTEQSEQNEQQEETISEPWWLKMINTLADIVKSLNLHPIINMIANAAQELTKLYTTYQNGR